MEKEPGITRGGPLSRYFESSDSFIRAIAFRDYNRGGNMSQETREKHRATLIEAQLLLQASENIGLRVTEPTE